MERIGDARFSLNWSPIAERPLLAPSEQNSPVIFSYMDVHTRSITWTFDAPSLECGPVLVAVANALRIFSIAETLRRSGVCRSWVAPLRQNDPLRPRSRHAAFAPVPKTATGNFVVLGDVGISLEKIRGFSPALGGLLHALRADSDVDQRSRAISNLRKFTKAYDVTDAVDAQKALQIARSAVERLNARSSAELRQQRDLIGLLAKDLGFKPE